MGVVYNLETNKTQSLTPGFESGTIFMTEILIFEFVYNNSASVLTLQ